MPHAPSPRCILAWRSLSWTMMESMAVARSRSVRSCRMPLALPNVPGWIMMPGLPCRMPGAGKPCLMHGIPHRMHGIPCLTLNARKALPHARYTWPNALYTS